MFLIAGGEKLASMYKLEPYSLMADGQGAGGKNNNVGPAAGGKNRAGGKNVRCS
jgi:hypothetical protein